MELPVTSSKIRSYAKGYVAILLQKELADCSKRFIGVTDIASVRFSLPAQLLEPTPNLGTWF